MLLQRTTPDGVEIAIKVVTRSSSARIDGSTGERLKVRVCAAPERAKANDEVRRLLAGRLRISPSRVRIISGETGPRKTVLLMGIPSGRIEELLREPA